MFFFYTATREAFRPLVRLQESDLLLTTRSVIEWWKDDEPHYLVLPLMIMLILGVSNCDFIQLTSKAFLEFAHKKKLITNWNEVYAAVTVKYVNNFSTKEKSVRDIS